MYGRLVVQFSLVISEATYQRSNFINAVFLVEATPEPWHEIREVHG